MEIIKSKSQDLDKLFEQKQILGSSKEEILKILSFRLKNPSQMRVDELALYRKVYPLMKEKMDLVDPDKILEEIIIRLMREGDYAKIKKYFHQGVKISLFGGLFPIVETADKIFAYRVHERKVCVSS